MEHKIIYLPPERWTGVAIPLDYESRECYDCRLTTERGAFRAEFIRVPMPAAAHTQEEYDFPDKLYAPYWDDAFAWGIAEDGRLLAAIETAVEGWSNRLVVTELWVHPSLRRCGVATALMNRAKERMRRERRRAIILETQSCNPDAIDFYLSQGFTFAGFDACCYKNDDIDRREVRIDLMWMPQRLPAFAAGELEIRHERPEDEYPIAVMTKRAFWNKHSLGCSEPLLVHKMRTSPNYLPALTFAALDNGRVAGYIMGWRAWVERGGTREAILSFGPLCVDPDYQGRHVGQLLMDEFIRAARDAGERGIVIFGEPDYYPLIGFKTTDSFGITAGDGSTPSALLGYELRPRGLSEIPGIFVEPPETADLPPEESERYNDTLPYMEKIRFPGQWAFHGGD